MRYDLHIGAFQLGADQRLRSVFRIGEEPHVLRPRRRSSTDKHWCADKALVSRRTKSSAGEETKLKKLITVDGTS